MSDELKSSSTSTFLLANGLKSMLAAASRQSEGLQGGQTESPMQVGEP
jgi:hypothetical protein